MGNPFYQRGPIRDSSYFYDREQETEQTANLLRVSQSVSVVGPRRIGKTSLLYHVQAPEVRAAHGLLPPEHIFASVDVEGMGQASQLEIYSLFLDALRGALAESSLQADWEPEASGGDYRLLDRALKTLRQHGRQVAFFIDEFELLAGNQNLDPAFFSGLRGLATRHAVSYVVASQRPLISLVYADRSVLSSPFFNVFATLPLGLFGEAAARDMLLALLSEGDATLPEPSLQTVVDLAGPHPFFLQVAAYHAYELAESKATWDGQMAAKLSDVFYEEALPHYVYYWHNLGEAERYALANLVAVEHDPGAREALQQLQQQCLIAPVDSGYRYLSLTLQRFVRRQSVRGLVQGGPFVIDLRRRAATAGDQTLKLTKTQLDLLACLAQHEGQTVTNRELEQTVWRDEYVEDPERLKAAIKHLRRALGPWGSCVVNQRGVGYALRLGRS